jgi:hypothetical protein
VTRGARVGPYELVERLGRGGMGEVWLAEDPTGASGGTPRRVALKLLDPGHVDDAAARARFAREVQAARRVSGPTIAALLDADVDAAHPWLASAYVAGPTLAEHVAAHGALGDPGLRALGSALAEALVSIHAAGVVHRDLTPRNVVLGPDGPRVVDFGIAWYDGAAAITETGARVGTPAWMAPERLTHDEVTPAGDVWSWGAVMAYAALGHPAVSGSGPEVVAQRIMRGEIDLAGVPSWLAPWVVAAMSVAPGERPPPAALVAAMAGSGSPTVVAIETGPVLDDGTGGVPPTTTVVVADVGPDGLTPTRPDVAPTVPLAGPGTAAAPGAPARSEPTRVYLAGDAPVPQRQARRRRRDAGTGTPPPPGAAGPVAPGDEAGPRVASPLVRLAVAAVVVGAAAVLGWFADLLIVVMVTAALVVLAVVLRLSRLRLPEDARPLPPTWSVALAGPVALGAGLMAAFGAVAGAAVLVVIVVLFVLLGGDIG